MGKIKSALELALEKTEGITADRERIKKDEDIRKIRVILSSFLNGDKNFSYVKDKTKSFTQSEVLKEAVTLQLLSSLNLREAEEGERIERVESIASLLENAELSSFVSEIFSTLKHYPEERENLIKEMKEQYRPILERKEMMLREKYGQDVRLDAENDKEFLEEAKKHLKNLEDEYLNFLSESKEKIKAFLQR